MNITKISARTGVQYLLKTIVEGDGVGADGKLAEYYSGKGNTPGVWLGSGLSAFDIEEGTVATKMEATLLFSSFLHPRNSTNLGQFVQLDDPKQVSGYDLTFHIPKSISIAWGIAAPDLQAAIEQCHDDAVKMTLDWIEENVARTRSGRKGIWSSPIKGLNAIAYKHFESRTGDPHLHTHCVISNRVQRSSDGKWLTLDGKALYRAAVTASEIHENLILNLLRYRLGATFVERERLTNSNKSVVLDLAGFTTEAIEQFSQRHFDTKAKYEEELDKWRANNPGQEPSLKVRNMLDKIAWDITRAPKDGPPAPRNELTEKWQDQFKQLGYTASDVLERSFNQYWDGINAESIAEQPEAVEKLAKIVIAHWRINRPSETPKETYASEQNCETADYNAPKEPDDEDVKEYLETHDPAAITEDLGRVVTDRLTQTRSAWTKGNARAEAERVLRKISLNPYEGHILFEAVTDAAITQCVQLSPQRYHVPEIAADDPRFMYHGLVGGDNADDQVYTAQITLDNEEFLNHLTERPTTNAVAEANAKQSLDAFNNKRPDKHLSPDQYAAAFHITTAPVLMTALVGPAGTGKTTTMKAVKQVWETNHGKGTVIGVGPSARAARELGDVGIPAMTIDSLLVANTPEAIIGRANWRKKLDSRLRQSWSPRQKAATLEQIAKAEAEAAALSLGPNSLLIVDEASMATTHQLAALGRLADRVGARIALVGDPKQLDSVGAGGILGWLDSQEKTVHLNELHRFKHEWERAASLRLREGDTSVLFPAGEGTKSVNDIYHAISRDRPEQFGHDHDKIMAEAERLHRDAGLPTYADNDRIHDGEENQMLEDAYQAVRTAQLEWVEETDPKTGRTSRRRKTTVLIAATNAHVNDLNQRFTADRRAAGEVDNTQTVAIRGGFNAGIGEIICARKNNNKILDSNGVRIENSNQLVITGFNYGENGTDIISARAHRYGHPNITITIPQEYLAKRVDLGYAVTSHRAQGLTVDKGVLFIPWAARLTRKLVYVSLTRGQYENHMFVATPTAEDLNHQHKPAFARNKAGKMVAETMTGAEIVAEMISTSDDALTAHETRIVETVKVSRLERLVGGHDIISNYVAGPWLHNYLTHVHGSEPANVMGAAPGWDALVTVFRRALFTDSDRALQLCRIPFPKPEDTQETSPAPKAPERQEGQEKSRGAKRSLELRYAVEKAKQEVERLAGPDAQQQTITAATVKADKARQKLLKAEQEWVGKHPDKELPEGKGTNVPKGIRTKRYAADDAAALAEAARDPEQFAKMIHDAAQTLQAAQAALKAFEPDWCSILIARLEKAIDNHSGSHIGDPNWIGGVITPIRKLMATLTHADTTMGLPALASTTDPLAVNLATQCEHMVEGRIGDLTQPDANPTTHPAAIPIPQWVNTLPPKPAAGDPNLSRWELLYEAVCAYRDRWGVTAQGDALGVEPTIGRQKTHYRATTELIDTYLNPEQANRRPRRPAPDPKEDPDFDWLTPAGIDRTLFPQGMSDREILSLYFDDPEDPGPEYHPDAYFEEPFYLPGDLDEQEPYRPGELDNAEPEAVPQDSWRDHTTEVEQVPKEHLDRLASINLAAYEYWKSRAGYAGSWVTEYLESRNLNQTVTPAHAPPGWATTLGYLTNYRGFTHEEIIAAGLAFKAKSGKVYDTFQDRLPIPIYDTENRIAGFTARANPNPEPGARQGPKYINTRDNKIYHKSHLLAGLDQEAAEKLREGWTPVLVEGAMDVAAIKASGAHAVPLAACGTAITPDQLALIASLRGGTLDGLIVALDNDAAGRTAAANLWETTIGPYEGARVRYANWRDAKDPAELVEHNKTQQITISLDQTTPLAVAWAVAQCENMAARQPTWVNSDPLTVMHHEAPIIENVALAMEGQSQDAIQAVKTATNPYFTLSNPEEYWSSYLTRWGNDDDLDAIIEAALKLKLGDQYVPEPAIQHHGAKPETSQGVQTANAANPYEPTNNANQNQYADVA